MRLVLRCGWQRKLYAVTLRVTLYHHRTGAAVGLAHLDLHAGARHASAENKTTSDNAALANAHEVHAMLFALNNLQMRTPYLASAPSNAA